ncbi:MAG: excinuclease ABC subunit UvrA [Cytophagales bacterium]|nr:excinuclease ABC subunit UvrA [Cytophagales bacterium]MDW8384548.1 excinuclease ABC subunit UvrA [Flammeovirgaceae bacterium]
MKVSESEDIKRYILIKGAKVHNLKNLSVAIPRNRLVVITGVSGSGKSSLAFDTLFAEGQRQYVESLNSYARQFLVRMEKPDVEYIKGISPAIAVEQKVTTYNPRSTVGTTTEIYDYLKLLFARIGKTYSPVSGRIVQKDSVSDVVDFIQCHENGTRYMILAPLVLNQNRKIADEFNVLLQKGFTRIVHQENIYQIEELLENNFALTGDLFLLIDRGIVEKQEEERQFRLADSIQTAFYEGNGTCIVKIFSEENKETRYFSDRFEADGIVFEEPSVNLFSFNNPYGACKTCEGTGKVIGIDKDLVIPDKSLSVYDGAIAPWRTDLMKEWLRPLLRHGVEFDFPVHRAYADLTPAQQELLWKGNEYFKGINQFFEYLESQSHKIQYRVLLSKYKGKTTCPDCLGTRIRKDASYVKIQGKSIQELVLMPISDLFYFFQNLQLSEYENQIAKQLLAEIRNRLSYLIKVGLPYLTLNRLTSTLSGGEYQRIKLATSLGSALVGSMYILDEPSIGLHPRDTKNLVAVLKELRDLGNTVIVVEHEEEVIRAADQIIDIGPDAGRLGGEIVFQGSWHDIQNEHSTQSHTIRFLKGIEQIPIPTTRRRWKEYIEVRGARENNLKNINVKFPLECLTVVTGVSGSGKSTLVKRILVPAMQRLLESASVSEVGHFDRLEGNTKQITRLEFIDQNPIGKSTRSNPVTYMKAYDAIRTLYAEQPLAKRLNYTPAFFSFNVPGGRCDACEGEGVIKVEMQFMADIYLTCEACKGKRFKEEILNIKYKEKSIYDVLEMTVDEAMIFFKEHPKIIERLQPLEEVGLGYIKLGQSSSTLSGGEAQRIKLAFFLAKGSIAVHERILFIFDEPTTGLHFHDINKLLYALQALIEKGHTVIVIEHNLDVIKCADWIIDLGPEGGEKGGYICFEGTPEEMIHQKDNITAQFLKEKFLRNNTHGVFSF